MRLTKVLLFLFIIPLASAQNLERKDVEQKYKWNLGDLFASENEVRATQQGIKKELDEVVSYSGKLAASSENLYQALSKYFDMTKNYWKLSSYTSMLSDEDLRDTKNQGLDQESQNLGTAISEKTAFINPEILRIDPKKIDQFYKEKKELEEFRVFITDIQRLRDHTLSESEEKILASFGAVTGTPGTVYNIFCNAEKPNPKVTLSDGQEVELTTSTYSKYRSGDNREDRKKIFKAFFDNYQKFQNTIGANFSGKVKADYVYAKNRKYNTALEYSLNASNIPVSVYENLVSQINKNLPTLHRFLNLKKKMLGVDTLHYYDIYTPLVKPELAGEMKFTIEQGQKIVSDALMPLGEEYHNTLQKAFNSRWIDYYPTVSKRSGAYSNGSAYDVHPYILTNWNGDYESVSTIAHELGHTMHSYFSNKSQPFVNSGYPIFVAEIASTINESLLNDYMVKNAKSKEQKLYLLGTYLDLLRSTIFRQTSFAEFELAAHKMAENNEPITGEALSKVYYDIVKKYYGNDQGICIVDPYIAYEWAFIPHFINYTYYVYQYSTSLIYATAIAEKIKNEGQPAIDKYYSILKGGSSEYPIDLIKKAGVDPLSSEAFELTINRMNKIMDQIDELIK
ncbi:MAG TPA: oligoendopeptidase F [Ignavibacteriaceae bacterium]|nr:oligoendopeptidase F [Ignavibacteriaceae bacterium]